MQQELAPWFDIESIGRTAFVAWRGRGMRGAVKSLVRLMLAKLGEPIAFPTLYWIARKARIQGVVKLTAIIARDGTVQKLEVGSGHPLLVPSALEAVKQWQYKPTLLNGEAVEVVTQIDVIFTLTG